jgi:hypothetical protein
VTGTAAQVTTGFDALAFTPTANQVAPGKTVTTDVTITVIDLAGQTATGTTTSSLIAADSSRDWQQ